MLRQINFNKLGIISIMPRFDLPRADLFEFRLSKDRNWPGGRKDNDGNDGEGGLALPPIYFDRQYLLLKIINLCTNGEHRK